MGLNFAWVKQLAKNRIVNNKNSGKHWRPENGCRNALPAKRFRNVRALGTKIILTCWLSSTKNQWVEIWMNNETNKCNDWMIQSFNNSMFPSIRWMKSW